MTHALSDLQPRAVWDYFYQLTQIPRPSKHEEAIQAFMLDFAQSLSLTAFRDEIGNIIIQKPATAGYENCKGVVLQSHLDMVPQANNDTPHDFTTDPIDAYVDGEWVTANGTTLGADNGMGVAAIMAVLADNTLQHGPLEALLTCDEETSMAGAFGLQPGVLHGEILLNLDSEDEKELYIGCAGGVDAVFRLPIQRQSVNEVDGSMAFFQVDLTGLKGGHSGMDIIRQRGNANKLLARLLSDVSTLLQMRIQHFSGGNLRNALPREATATIALSHLDGAAEVGKQSVAEVLAQCVSDFSAQLAREYGTIEPNVAVSVTAVDVSAETTVLCADSQRRLLGALHGCPNGVHRMSLDMPDLVETSSNLAIVNTEAQQVIFECLLRSSVDSARDELAVQIASVFELAGATSDFKGAYPGWQPNPNSEILEVMKKTGEQLFGQTPKLCAIHAGLECGILGGTYPHWDMISFGPTIRAPHSPDEKVNIASVSSFYDWLVATLQAIPRD